VSKTLVCGFQHNNKYDGLQVF